MDGARERCLLKNPCCIRETIFRFAYSITVSRLCDFAGNESPYRRNLSSACAHTPIRNNDERVVQGNDRQIPSQDVSRFRNSFVGRNKFLKDPTSARFTTVGRKIPAVTLRDLDVVEIRRCVVHILEIRSRRNPAVLNY